MQGKLGRGGGNNGDINVDVSDDGDVDFDDGNDANSDASDHEDYDGGVKDNDTRHETTSPASSLSPDLRTVSPPSLAIRLIETVSAACEEILRLHYFQC